MNYQEAISIIHEIPWKSHEPGLKRITELMELMGNPQKKTKFIHIAGSNGKGSCSALTASILQKAGYKTGLCISPYIHRFNERMQINSEHIDDDELAEITEKVKACADKMSEHPTEFEFVNAITFEYFARHNCDIAVLEVGLGGRLDATNVIDSPVAAVITSIALEHTSLLGDTVEKIAAEKAGIIKPGCTAVISRQQSSIIDVVSNVCKEKGVKLFEAKNDVFRVSQDINGQIVRRGNETYQFPLLGEHQIRNLSTVFTLVDVLRDLGYNISQQALSDGIRNVYWPGRFELMQTEPPFFVDGGHNPQCAVTVAKTIKELYKNKKIVLLLGVLSDKDVRGVIEPIISMVRTAVTITPPTPRALSAEDLSDIFMSEFGIKAVPCDSIKSGVETALMLSAPDEVICAYGSLYNVGEIRKCFGKER